MDFDRLYDLVNESNELSNKEKLKIAKKASETQRNIPESVMRAVYWNCKKNNISIPPFINWGIEHYGDLSHRAQEFLSSIENVKEKITVSYITLVFLMLIPLMCLVKVFLYYCQVQV